MKNKLVLLLITLFGFTGYAWSQSEFSNIPLTWKHFKPTNLSNQVYKAAIVVSHNNEMSYLKQGKEVTIELTSKLKLETEYCLVDKKFLNTASDSVSMLLLDHEKGHFIISLIFYKKLLEAFSAFEFTANYKQELRELIQKITAEKELMNQQYDQETQHHMRQDVQREWNKKLHQYLKQYGLDTALQELNQTTVTKRIIWLP